MKGVEEPKAAADYATRRGHMGKPEDQGIDAMSQEGELLEEGSGRVARELHCCHATDLGQTIKVGINGEAQKQQNRQLVFSLILYP